MYKLIKNGKEDIDKNERRIIFIVKIYNNDIIHISK